MFDFLSGFGRWVEMAASVEERRVGIWKEGNKMVSTVSVNDGVLPYETAFQHPEYDEGKMIIVEAYDNKESAKEGHDKWVKIMTGGPLPDELRDCCNADCTQLANDLGLDPDEMFVHPRQVAKDEGEDDQ